MAGEWIDTTLGEFAPFLYGRGLPEVRRRPGSVPVYGSNGIVGFHSETLLSGPAVIIGRKGSVGAVHYCPEPCWPIDTTFYVVDDDPARLRFKYYLLKSLGLEHMNADSAVPGLNRDAAHARIIKVPPLPEQRAIAHILGTLDDKIELNRRMSETLEAMARAIFKAWFVDFEPVRAKCRVEPPCSPQSGQAQGPAPTGEFRQWPQHILDLFPDRLVDSELGEIPKGWKVSTVGEVCEFAYGKALKADKRRLGLVPVIGSHGQVGLHDEPLVKGPGIVVGRKGNPGIVTWVDVDFFPIDTTFYVVLRDNSCPLTYVFYALEKIDLAHLGADSAVPGLNRNIAYGSKFVVPDLAILDIFNRHILEIRKRAFLNNIQSRTLAALRDALLPKLISGEIRVKDAEKLVLQSVPNIKKED